MRHGSVQILSTQAHTYILTFTTIRTLHTRDILTEISREAGDWQGLAIKEWAATQGLALDTSQPALKAAKWLALQLLRRREQPLCIMCKQRSVTCMHCQECSHPYCSACLKLEPDCCWDIDFCCPPCVVAGLITLQPRDPASGSPYLLQLAFSAMRSASHRLALSTWKGYIRCVQKAITFTEVHGVVCFPVLNGAIAKGCQLFFQHLRAQGLAWGTMRTFRSAFKSFHAALGIEDPWVKYPALFALTAGLQKQISLPPRPKVGLTIIMLKAMIRYIEVEEPFLRQQNRHGTADVLLRDAVFLIIAFFAMRRSDEVFVNKTHTHGILQSQIVLEQDRYVQLFVPAQKTDPTHQGHFVTLAWVSGSGVKIGFWIQRLLRRLQICGARHPACPLFLPTRGNHGFHRVYVGQAVTKPNTFESLLPRVFAIFRTQPQLLRLFGNHSCRRGGATHAFWQGVCMKLLAPHGGWRSEAGLKTYTSASFGQRMSVTLQM